MAIDKDLALLELLDAPGSRRGAALGVSRAAALSGLDKGLASRRLAALEAEAILERDPETLEYRLGWRLPWLLAGSYPLRVMYRAGDALNDVASRYPGSIRSLIIRRHENIVIVFSSAASDAVDHRSWEESNLPAWPTAPGRVLLSDLSLTELRALHPEGLKVPEGMSPAEIEVDELWQRLQQIHARGFAVSDGEYQHELVSVAAPIRDDAGRIIAALNLAGFRMDLADAAQRSSMVDAVGRDLAKAAASVSLHLGWNPSPVS